MIRISSREPDDPNPALIFTVGAPGSGKTSWVKSLLEQDKTKGIVVVCPDDIRYKLTGDMSDQTKNGQVWAEAKRQTVEALKSGKDVILDATNVSSSNRKNFLKGLPPHDLYAKRFEADPEESIKRIKKDIEDKKLRSDVPEHVIRRMHDSFGKESTKEKLEQEGFKLYD